MQRCRGCGIGLKDAPEVLALHLANSRICLVAYNDTTIWHDGWEIICGTLHIRESGESKRGKWQIRGLQRTGRNVMVRRVRTKMDAQQWIEIANRKGSTC